MSPIRLGLAACLYGTVSLSAHALSLDQAMQAASERAPDILAATAASRAAQSLTVSAGALPDPKLSAWVDDLPTSGPDRFRPGGAKRVVSVMQELPSSARREAEQRLAETEVRTAQARERFARLNVRREAALAWLGLYYVDRRVAVLDAQDALNQQWRQRDLASIAGGASPATAFGARTDALDLQDARDDLQAQRAQAVARLARWIGTSANTADGELPGWVSRPQVDDSALDQQPDIRTASLQHEAASAELALARAATHPNWGVELGFGLDAMDKGMAMVKFSVDLPIFQSTRQEPRIAAAQAEIDRSQAERDARLAEAHSEYATLLAERDALQRQLSRIDTDTLPLIDRQIQLALASVAGARSDTTAVIEARRARLAAQLRRIDIESRLAAANTRLYFLTGER
ncbi:MAG: TolC family protein [Rhodocyclaceae bacterium]